MQDLVTNFIAAANAFDEKAVLALFASRPVIDDSSVGKVFKGASGVRKYFREYFVGYHTVTKLDALQIIDVRRVKAQVDFTGDFGHEKGVLDVTASDEGLITRIEAWLL